ncbi:MAG: ABC transporter permease [Acidobacteria bacterium]|nr:ABC transporter permease [Acidobacteriota bacterium]
MLRYRSGLFQHAVAPLSQLAMFYYLSRAVGSQFQPEGMPYFLFLMVGSGFYSFLVTGMYSFLRIIHDSQQTGTLEVLMTTSTRPTVLLVLSVISSFSGGLLELMAVAGGSLLIYSQIPQINWIGCALVFVLSVLLSVAIGVFAAALQLSIQKGSAALWLFGSSAWFISGTLFPVTILPRPIQVVSNLLPVTHALRGMRLAVFQAHHWNLLWPEIEVLLLFCVLLVPPSLLFFSWTLRRARQLGSLCYY